METETTPQEPFSIYSARRQNERDDKERAAQAANALQRERFILTHRRIELSTQLREAKAKAEMELAAIDRALAVMKPGQKLQDIQQPGEQQ